MASAALHELLNAMPDDDAARALRRCCGSTRWVRAMIARRPFGSAAQVHDEAATLWRALDRDDVLEAFADHPPIGGGRPAVDGAQERRLRDTAAWSNAEQAAVAEATDGTKRELADANEAYLARFGFIFIVCASGKSAGEMLGLLRARLGNDPRDELAVAAAEQEKITHLRLEKLAS